MYYGYCNYVTNGSNISYSSNSIETEAAVCITICSNYVTNGSNISYRSNGIETATTARPGSN